MRSRDNTLFLMAATMIVAVYAFAQTAPGGLTTTQQWHTSGDGPSTGWPANGAYKAFSDPRGWNDDAKAWYKQHMQGAFKLSERPKAIDPGLLLAGPCHPQPNGSEAAIISTDQKDKAEEGSANRSAARRCLHST